MYVGHSPEYECMLRFRECEARRNRVCLELPGGETMDDEKKKVKQAIALEYDPSDDAPRVVASGKGILAEKIIEKAQESSVPIHRDDKLADTLSRLDIGEMIPPELYEVVAEILVFVDAVDHRMVKDSAANGGKQKI